MSLIKCSECGKSVSSSAKICPHCGIKQEVNKTICEDCGNEISVTDIKCSECGCPVSKKENVSDSNVLYEGLNKITGAKVEKIVTLKSLFKNTFEKHTEDDFDELFTCGGKKTTPNVKDIDPKKASAWVYLRVLVFFVIAYIIMYVGFVSYNNSNFLPGFVFVAGFAVPVTVLIFFFEINLFKNIPFYKVIKYFILGGAMSLILAILYFSLTNAATTATYVGAMLIGLIEEVAKAAIVVVFLFKEKRSNYILDGLLIGAAVGAGFAAFETCGYILRFGLDEGLASMLNVIKLRALLAPGGHVAWAAIEGAGLMYIKGFSKLDKKHFNDPKYLMICAIPIVLHGVWDMPIDLPYYSLYITLIVLAWIVVIYFINLGLKQIEDAKKLKKNE